MEVWAFARKWGGHQDEDLRSAVATCLIEHLLEHHFESIIPLVERECAENETFRQTVEVCWEFGDTLEPANRKRFHALRKEKWIEPEERT